MTVLYKARLIRGKYHEKDEVTGEVKNYSFKNRPVITSRIDLVKTFGRQMFEPIGTTEVEETDSEESDTPPNDDSDNGYELAKMTVKELRAFALAEEIDLDGANTKAEIISTLEAAIEERGH